MTHLYHATFTELKLGELVQPVGPTTFYPLAANALDLARPSGTPSRTVCVFASDILAGVVKYARRQRPDTSHPPHVYSVEMPVFHRAPMCIVHLLESQLAAGKPVARLIQEYWAPAGVWNFYEYFGPSFTPIAKIPIPSEGAIMVLTNRYWTDRDRANSLRED